MNDIPSSEPKERYVMLNASSYIVFFFFPRRSLINHSDQMQLDLLT